MQSTTSDHRPGRLAGKRCLLLGGSGGLGQAATIRFLEEGASVVLVGNDPVQGEDIVGRLGSSGRCWFLAADLTHSAEMDRLLVEALQRLGGVDVLYHLVGGSGRRLGDGSLHECTEEGWRATLDLNLSSVFYSNRALVRYWLESRTPGVILNLASVLAIDPAPRYFDTCAYTAAKGAMISLSRQVASRYASVGIRVNVLAPGLIATPMARRALGDPDILQYLQRKQPLRPGPGVPEDCAGAAVFLCSDEAQFITGAVLPVDGGWSVCDSSP